MSYLLVGSCLDWLWLDLDTPLWYVLPPSPHMPLMGSGQSFVIHCHVFLLQLSFCRCYNNLCSSMWNIHHYLTWCLPKEYPYWAMNNHKHAPVSWVVMSNPELHRKLHAAIGYWWAQKNDRQEDHWSKNTICLNEPYIRSSTVYAIYAANEESKMV